MIDYRIVNFEKIKTKYLDFLQENSSRRADGRANEFEPPISSLQELAISLGFPIFSVIVAFIPYLTEEKIDRYENSNLSLHAISPDYHKLSKGILEFLVNDMLKSESKYYIQCDNGLLNERFFAFQSGLCMKGTNGLAIHPQYGSYGFLGLIVTEESLEEKVTEPKTCRGCDLCIKYCPAQAIMRDGVDGNRCISYLTQKKELTGEEEELIRRSSKAFGCDICQIVCPENKNIKYTEIEDFKQNLLYNIDLEELSSYGNRAFKKNFGDRNFSWRGKKVLVRNLGLQKDE